MHCRNCGSEVADLAVVCETCGKQPSEGEAFCPQCGAATTPGQVACAQCGVALGSAPAPQMAAAPPPAPMASPPPPIPPSYNTLPPQAGDPKAVTSLVLGIIGVFAWCIPLIGCPIGIIGIIMGALSLNGPKRTMAIWGLALSIFCIVGVIANGAIGAYLGATGQNPLVNHMMRK